MPWKKVNVYFSQASFFTLFVESALFCVMQYFVYQTWIRQTKFLLIPYCIHAHNRHGSCWGFFSVNCSALCDSKLWSSLFFFKMNKYFKKETVNGPNKKKKKIALLKTVHSDAPEMQLLKIKVYTFFLTMIL